MKCERLDLVESRSMHGQLPIVWDGALDSSVWDVGENKFIDFTSSIFVANVGCDNTFHPNAFIQAWLLHKFISRAQYCIGPSVQASIIVGVPSR